MTHPLHTVDVFTEKALAGNQLAVVLDAADISGADMQRIAREMNISETTFVLPPDDPAHAARLRIFTPGVELPFAGHPTIGTAWVLATHGLVPKAVARSRGRADSSRELVASMLSTVMARPEEITGSIEEPSPSSGPKGS